ncbi:MAG: hypothetical protein R3Y36_03685 [Spirochaetales bacterium]
MQNPIGLENARAVSPTVEQFINWNCSCNRPFVKKQIVAYLENDRNQIIREFGDKSHSANLFGCLNCGGFFFANKLEQPTELCMPLSRFIYLASFCRHFPALNVEPFNKGSIFDFNNSRQQVLRPLQNKSLNISPKYLRKNIADVQWEWVKNSLLKH